MVEGRLTFSRRDECIDDNLGAVEKIAELSFPDGKEGRSFPAGSVFKL